MELVIETQLFACIDYFKKLIEISNIKIEKYEYFRKTSFRNRYVIAGANGLSNLTIPIKGGREQKTMITEIEIDDTIDWRTKHWRSIVSSYRKAPFFEYYSEEIQNLLFNNEKKLFNFNNSILTRLCNILDMNTIITFTDQYFISATELDFRNKILPKDFQQQSINWQPKYAQVFEDRLGFQQNLSILDLLFCEGPNSINLLKESIKEKN